MVHMFVGRVMDSNGKPTIFRLCNLHTFQFVEVEEVRLGFEILHGNIVVLNLKAGMNLKTQTPKLDTDGSRMSNYPIVHSSNMVENGSHITVLGKLESTDSEENTFLVANIHGEIRQLAERDLVELTKIMTLTNAKLVGKFNNRIAGIYNPIEVLNARLSTNKYSTKKQTKDTKLRLLDLSIEEFHRGINNAIDKIKNAKYIISIEYLNRRMLGLVEAITGVKPTVSNVVDRYRAFDINLYNQKITFSLLGTVIGDEEWYDYAVDRDDNWSLIYHCATIVSSMEEVTELETDNGIFVFKLLTDAVNGLIMLPGLQLGAYYTYPKFEDDNYEVPKHEEDEFEKYIASDYDNDSRYFFCKNGGMWRVKLIYDTKEELEKAHEFIVEEMRKTMIVMLAKTLGKVKGFNKEQLKKIRQLAKEIDKAGKTELDTR